MLFDLFFFIFPCWRARFPCWAVGSARSPAPKCPARGCRSLAPLRPPPPPLGKLAPCRRLFSCLRPLCRSPAPACSSAAASWPARPSLTRLKSAGEKGEERVRRGPRTPSGSALPVCGTGKGAQGWGTTRGSMGWFLCLTGLEVTHRGSSGCLQKTPLMFPQGWQRCGMDAAVMEWLEQSLPRWDGPVSLWQDHERMASLTKSPSSEQPPADHRVVVTVPSPPGTRPCPQVPGGLVERVEGQAQSVTLRAAAPQPSRVSSH